MNYKDYYKILGIDKNASEKEIKSAYRKLARQYHPDVNAKPNAEERFKEVNEAYQVLSDPEKRAKYNRLGSDWYRWQQGGGQASNFDWNQWRSVSPGQQTQTYYGTPDEFRDLFGGGSNSPFSSFFQTIFAGMGNSGQKRNGSNPFDPPIQAQKGQDVEQIIEISLTEAYQGSSRVLNKNGRILTVKIPAGAKTGTRIRLKEQGTPSMAGGPPGDLYLRVKVMPDPHFERTEETLHTSVTVDLYTAILGGKVTVPTLAGDVTLKIPAGVQNGQRFRLQGKGMPYLKTPKQYGDLYVEIMVQLPNKLSAKEKALFKQLRAMTEQSQKVKGEGR